MSQVVIKVLHKIKCISCSSDETLYDLHKPLGHFSTLHVALFEPDGRTEAVFHCQIGDLPYQFNQFNLKQKTQRRLERLIHLAHSLSPASLVIFRWYLPLNQSGCIRAHPLSRFVCVDVPEVLLLRPSAFVHILRY